MKVSKASKEFATRVFRLCTENGSLNENKLSDSIKFLSKKRPSDYRGILTALKSLVRLDVEKRTVHVESAQDISQTDSKRIQDSIIKKHGKGLVFSFITKPELIGGLKVRVGSQVYDSSVLAKINRLSNSL